MCAKPGYSHTKSIKFNHTAFMKYISSHWTFCSYVSDFIHNISGRDNTLFLQPVFVLFCCSVFIQDTSFLSNGIVKGKREASVKASESGKVLR